MTKSTANNKATAKPRGKPWPKGQSGNPAGRPKDGESWAAIIKAVGNMYPEDVLGFVGKDNDLGRNLVLLPKGVQMKYLVTARVYAALMFEPSATLWKDLMDRVEGKVQDRVDVTSGGEKIQPKVDDERFDRAITSLADAIRESVSGTGTKPDGKVDTTE